MGAGGLPRASAAQQEERTAQRVLPAAVDAGVDAYINTAINGMGERAGNADLVSCLLACLKSAGFKNKYQIDENIDDYRFYNDASTIVSSFNDIINTLFIALIVFIIIISLTSIFIIFSLTFYSYLSSKKERAILFLLGSNKKSIDLIYVLEPLIIYLISFIGGLILFNVIKNPILNKINSVLTINLAINPSLLFIFIIFIIYFLIILLSSLIPLLISKNIDIAKELKEE